jgi:hypothetical protein
MKRLAALLPVVLLAACHPSDPGAASPAEAQQLNDATAMMDANSVDINAVTPNSTDPNSTDQEQPQ